MFFTLQVNKPTLCKNIIRAISSDAAIPPLESYGMADQVRSMWCEESESWPALIWCR
jgi:hypothetical protein